MVNKLSKKILALLMTLAMVISLMPTMTLSASAAPITGSTDITNAQTVPEGSTEVMTRYDVPLYYKFIPTTTASYTITTSGGIPEVYYMGTLYNVPNTASALAQGGDLSGHVSITYTLTQDVTYYIGLLNDSEPSTSCMLNITAANTAPTVTTQEVRDITQTAAKVNGNITDLGTPNPTQYGVVWGMSANPTTTLSTKTTQGAASSAGAFTSNITGLTAGTTYHVRAYATNSAGTSYGEDVTFTTHFAPPTVTGISPMSGRTAGGTSVTITGTNFTGATAVKFGTTNATSYTVNSATQITATSPAGSIGTVDITVTTPGGTSGTVSGDRFSYYGTASTVNEKYAFEGDNSKTFTEGGLTFNITGSYLHVEQNVGLGIDDESYVENSDIPFPGAGVIGSFQCTTSDFNVQSLYLITLDSYFEIIQYNNILIRGKLDGATMFTHTVPSDSINTTDVYHCYTYIDLSSYNSYVIDELEFEVENCESGQFLMIDDFSFNQVITNPPPTVTDANISISGGTGTGGTYKIGDTVTATWNNTVDGDNNTATITGVTVDFSQFGGGASVAATNNSGIWTATYTIVAGNIDATNRNVSITVMDNAANSTTTSDTTNAMVDNVAPTASISSTAGANTNTSPISITITFSENVTGFIIGDITVGNGTAENFGGSGTTYTADITPSAQGAVTVDVAANVAQDDAGNNNTVANQLSRTYDSKAPTIGVVSNGGLYNVSVSPTFDEGTATLAKDGGTANSFTSGTSIAAEGSYVLVVTDTASNSTTASFTIDKTAPTVAGVVNNANYNTSVAATFTEGSATLSQNAGVANEYNPGDSIDDSGSYVLVIADTAGNSNTVSFIIDTTAPSVTTSENQIVSTTAAINEATVCALTATDATAISGFADSLSWSISGGADSGEFSISGANLQINNAGGLSAGDYTVQVTAKDTAGNTDVLDITVHVVSGPTVEADSSKVYNDTAADDTFDNKEGNISAKANSGSITKYGIHGITTDVKYSYNSITYNVSKAGTYGTLYVKSDDGKYVYVPVSNAKLNEQTATVTDSFTIEATDSAGTAGNTLTITINGVNDTPSIDALSVVEYTDTSAADTFSNAAGTLKGKDRDSAASLTYGISDAEAGADIGGVTYDVSKTGDYGTLYVNSGSGEYVYVPNNSAINKCSIDQSDIFTLTVSDGALSATQTFTVSITAANDTPIIKTNAGITVDEGSADTVIAQEILELTDVDTAAASIIYTLTALPSKGTIKKDGTALSLNGTFTQDDINNGKITYTHDGSESTSDSFTFTVTDGSNSIAETTFAITVKPVNDAPVIKTGTKISVTEGVKDAFKAQAEDAEKDSIKWSITGGADEGKFEIDETTGAVIFKTTPSFSAPTDDDADNDYVLEITASDGDLSTPKTITITVTQQVVSGGADTGAAVEVNGQKQDAGTSTTQTTGDQTVTTIKVDDLKLDKILETSGEKPTVTLPSSGNSNVVVGELNGQTVKNMENREATLQIRTDTITYTLPASQINIDAVSNQIGSQVELKDIKVNVKIAESSADTVKIVEDTANKGNYQIVVKPVEFEITCTSGDKTIEISRFNGYVERTVAIPDGIDPSKITTGIVLNPDGTFRHVPTEIIVINGKYYAKINSLSNSTYSVIFNPVEFADVSSHWAKDAINDMGSRMVVTGVGNNSYEPDRSITRAEFAAIVVRAMGLQKGTTESSFKDVTLTDWFNGYVDTATAYSLITGYDSNSFGPNDTITREQAITILARAMKITGLNIILSDSEVSELLSKYTDGGLVSDYARAGVAACVKAGVVSGTGPTTISPKDYVTRAEVAMMAQRMLQKSGLI